MDKGWNLKLGWGMGDLVLGINTWDTRMAFEAGCGVVGGVACNAGNWLGSDMVGFLTLATNILIDIFRLCLGLR